MRSSIFSPCGGQPGFLTAHLRSPLPHLAKLQPPDHFRLNRFGQHRKHGCRIAVPNGQGSKSEKHKPEEIIGELREAEIVLAAGGTAADGCRRIGVTEKSYTACASFSR